MRLLLCGLNPSIVAADEGIPFARPGNRFWPAVVEAGLTDRVRDVQHLLTAHGIGMTDLVKRPTPRAAELSADEYRSGLDRVERLAALAATGQRSASSAWPAGRAALSMPGRTRAGRRAPSGAGPCT